MANGFIRGDSTKPSAAASASASMIPPGKMTVSPIASTARRWKPGRAATVCGRMTSLPTSTPQVRPTLQSNAIRIVVDGKLVAPRPPILASHEDRNGRAGGIRTHDPLPPRQVRYQTALQPVSSTEWEQNRRNAGWQALKIISPTGIFGKTFA